MRTVLEHERLQRRRLADEVAHRDATMSGLHLSDAEGDERGGDRIRADDDEGVAAAERAAQRAPLGEPVHLRGHGPPS